MVVVEITETGFNIEIFRHIDEICHRYSNSDSIIIDMPIGLPEAASDIRPDGEARKLLSTRASCVFNSPCRQAVYAEEYPLANNINKTVLGKGLSKQSYMIIPKIKEIDIFLNNVPNFKNKLVEAHPEVCFAILNWDGLRKIPILENKKTKEGIAKRLEVLRRHYSETDELDKVMINHPKYRKMKDDIIDALCLAVTGMLGYEHGLGTIPEQPKVDHRGLLMQMVYAKLI